MASSSEAIPAALLMMASAGSSMPKPMFASIVSEKRNASWATNPIARRSTSSGQSLTSTPSTRTAPGGGSISLGMKLTSVDLPLPVRPTIPSDVPAGTLTETWSRIVLVAPGCT
jgi:hypothetical protein